MPIWLIVVLVVVALLAIGGAVATAQRTRAQRDVLERQLADADRELAQAHAQDKGWERAALEAAAREAFAERHGGAEVRELRLVQVVDRAGTDADQAIFRVKAADGDHELVLGRREGRWVLA